GRGEEVYALPDLPPLPVVVVTPDVAVSTPKAFSDWDFLVSKLTEPEQHDTIKGFSHTVFAWLTGTPTGVSPAKGNRAEALLLDLVRAGIENDFERVVFPQHPELRDSKRALERLGARYASLSGSGSSLYGLFGSKAAAEKAARKLTSEG